jgi:hypothetical protein
MKLSKYAETIGISYDTALRWFKAGKIKGYRAHTGTIIVTESVPMFPHFPIQKREKQLQFIPVCLRLRIKHTGSERPSPGDN